MYRRAAYLLLLLVITSAVSSCGRDAKSGEDWQFETRCGDNVALGDEACDGSDLLGRDCQSFGFPDGELRCNDSCTGFVVGQCSGVPEWSVDDGSGCHQCADDEVCVDGRCEAICTGAPVEGETLAFEVYQHAVLGSLTLAGEPVNPVGPRPAVRFINQQTRDNLQDFVDHELTDDGRYGVALFPGTYDVYAYGELQVDGRPSFDITRKVASDVVVDADRTVDIDLPEPIRLDVAVEMSQRARDFGMPGRVLVERLEEGPDGPRAVVLEAIDDLYGPGVTIDTLPGTFQARFVYESDEHDGDLQAPTREVLWGPQDIVEDAQVSVPLAIHTLSGQVNFRDGLPDGPEKVRVDVERRDSDERTFVAYLDADGRFSVPLVAGEFEVRAYIPSLHEEERYTVVEQVDLNDDVELAITMGEGLVAVQGRVESLPTDEGTPLLYFLRHAEPYAHRLVAVEEGRFETSLPPGTYDVAISHIDTESWEAPTYELATVEVSAEANEPLVFDVDQIDSTTIRGEVTVNGEVMPDPSTDTDSPRGYIAFERVTPRVGNWIVTKQARLPARGTADYEVKLAPGVYRVVLYSGQDPSGTPVLNTSMPPADYVLDPRLEIGEADVTRDFDVKMVRLSGEVTASGGPLPTDDEFEPTREWRSPQHIELSLPIGRSPEWRRSLEISDDGRVHLSQNVLPGQYKLYLPFLGFDPRALYQVPGLTHRFGVGDDTDVAWDVPLRHAEVNLTYRRPSGDVRPIDYGSLVARTQLGRFEAEIESADGTRVWWLGEDPTFIFRPGENDAMVLRRGCVDGAR